MKARTLLFAGKVGTGFNVAMLRTLHQQDASSSRSDELSLHQSPRTQQAAGPKTSRRVK